MRKLLLLSLALACLHAVAVNAAPVKYLNSGKILPVELPFSEAVLVGDTLYLSGQLGSIPGTLQLVSGGFEAQALQTLKNIQTVLVSHGFALHELVKCTVMLADIADWPAFNKIYASFLQPPYPARSAFGASGLGLGALLEVECIAVHHTD